MAASERRARGELEAAVMDVLWSADGWLAPADVQRTISTRRRTLAYTTVMTILVRLWKKGMVERRLEGRCYVYRPVASRDEWTAQRMRDLLERAGDPAVALGHFVESIDATGARQLRRLLERRKRR